MLLSLLSLLGLAGGSTAEVYGYTLDAFQFRKDDGLEDAATNLGAVNERIEVAPGQVLRLRQVVQNTGTKDADPGWNYLQWKYRINGGAWTDPGELYTPSLGPIYVHDTPWYDIPDLPGYADNPWWHYSYPTTQQIGAGTFAPNVGTNDATQGPGIDGGTAAWQTGLTGYLAHAQGHEIETELNFTLQGADAYAWADGDLIEFKILAFADSVNGGEPTDTGLVHAVRAACVVRVAAGTWEGVHGILVDALEAEGLVHDGGADIDDPDGGAPGPGRFYIRATGSSAIPATCGDLARTAADLVIGTRPDDGGDQAAADLATAWAALRAAADGLGGARAVLGEGPGARLSAEPEYVRGEHGAAWRSRLFVEWTT